MAIINNGYPQGYSTNYSQGYGGYTPMNTQSQSSNSIVWVQGEAGAKAYPVAAGNTVMMLDSEDSVFYLKTTDMSGMPMPLRIFDFTERTEEMKAKKSIDTSEFVTRKELEKKLRELTRKEDRNYGNKSQSKRQSII